MTYYNSAYTTPEAVNRQLVKAKPNTSLVAASSEFNEYFALVTEYCKQFSDYVTKATSRVFVPYKDTREYYFRDTVENYTMLFNRGRRTLLLGEDLLSLSSITWNGTLLSATDYREGTPNRLPYRYIDFNNTSNLAWSSDFNDYIEIVGTWGYHNNLSQAYTASGQTMTINASATTVVVATASAFETLQYIRVESELMQITNIATGTNTLTLSRGVNGTTAASHTSAAIEIYSVVPAVALAVTRMVAWAYNNRNDLGNVIQFQDGTSVVQNIAPFIREILRFVDDNTPVSV